MLKISIRLKHIPIPARGINCSLQAALEVGVTARETGLAWLDDVASMVWGNVLRCRATSQAFVWLAAGVEQQSQRIC